MKKATPIIAILLSILLIYVLGNIEESTIQKFIVSWGDFSIIAIIILLLASQVFAPFSGAPVMFIGFKVIGFSSTMILFYFVSILSSIINFWIAKKFGRGLVAKFIGLKALEKVDAIAKSEERALLIWSRIVGYYFFDLISYAIGLTNISFKKYFASTLLLTIIPWAGYFVIFSFLDMKSTTGMLMYYLSLLLTTIIFGRIFWKLLDKKTESKLQIDNHD